MALGVVVGRGVAVPAGGGPESEPYLSRWGANAEQQCWPLRRGLVTIGRGSSADVVIDGDQLVSRLHSTLERVAGVWTSFSTSSAIRQYSSRYVLMSEFGACAGSSATAGKTTAESAGLWPAGSGCTTGIRSESGRRCSCSARRQNSTA